jgi:hypothetical protein
MNFHLNFNLDNDWFDQSLEPRISDILKVAADDVYSGLTSGHIQDGNGNTIGSWEITHSFR